ncbi:MAG: hypothetical protein CL878_00370 [Dehalococcoidia bacterium]|nr:hypothetical protein [Dehalococcoidia bacterium]
MSTEAPRPDALQQDLAQARDIQEGLLLQVDEVPTAVEVEAFCEPATAVGGDFYDIVGLSEGRVAVAVGDVSGHGIAAATLATQAREALRSALRQHGDPADAINEVNRTLVAAETSGMFVAVVCVILDLWSGEAQVTAAGNPVPVVRHLDGTVTAVETLGSHFPLGLLVGEPYQSALVQVGLGETVVLYSDGIVETAGEQPGEAGLFGFDRLDETVAAAADGGATGLVQSVRAAVAAHQVGEQQDDLTLLALRWVERTVVAPERPVWRRWGVLAGLAALVVLVVAGLQLREPQEAPAPAQVPVVAPEPTVVALPTPQPGWSTAQLSERRGFFAVTAVGDKVLVAGGGAGGPARDYSTVVDIYDTATRSWSTAALSQPRPVAAVTTVGTKAFLALDCFNDVDIYDGTTGTWSTTEFSRVRCDPAATSAGTQLLFAGGCGRGSSGGCTPAYDTVDIYDVSQDTWSSTRLSEARAKIVAVSVGTKALFAGGCLQGCGTYSNRVDIYDSATGRWSTATLPSTRAGFSTAVVGSTVLFAGDVVDIYDAATGTWSTTRLPVPRTNLAVTTIGTQAFYAGGGRGTRGTADVQVYDVATDTWTSASLSQARHSVAAISVGRRALFAGGAVSATIPSAVVDIYDADKGPPTDPAAWSSATLSEARSDIKAVVVGDQVLFIGGLGENRRPSAVVDIYDSSAVR